MLRDLKESRRYYARKVKALVRDFDDSLLSQEYLPFLEALTGIADLLEIGELTALHQTIILVAKRCPLVHSETKRRRKALWERIAIIQREVTAQADDDPELKELKCALALVSKVLSGLPERLTIGSDGVKVTVTVFFQKQMLSATRVALTVARVA